MTLRYLHQLLVGECQRAGNAEESLAISVRGNGLETKLDTSGNVRGNSDASGNRLDGGGNGAWVCSSYEGIAQVRGAVVNVDTPCKCITKKNVRAPRR